MNDRRELAWPAAVVVTTISLAAATVLGIAAYQEGQAHQIEACAASGGSWINDDGARECWLPGTDTVLRGPGGPGGPDR